MKSYKVLFGIALLITQFSSAQTWSLIWEDEFNGTGLPDGQKWGYDTGNGGWGNYELQNYTANRTENARQENGNLILEARRDWHNGIEYSSARLVSKFKGDWTYGRIEVKAKVPLGQGLWPAIWMLPTDYHYGNWPASGEIDIMENFALGGIKPNTIEGNVHTKSYNHMIGTNKGGTSSWLSNIEDNYHVYAVNWYEDKIEFEVDGQIYFSFANEGNWEAWPYDKRFHLILNIAVGGTLGTTPDPNIFPKKMMVDYVKVYELKTQPSPTIGLVSIYDDVNYTGFSAGLEIGEYTMADLALLGMQNDKITSLQISEGYQAILFQHDNFTGNSTIINSSNGALNGIWNNQTTSIKVEANGDENLEGVYYIKNKVSAKVMDVLGYEQGNGANIGQYSFGGNNNQQFNFTHQGNGAYRITSEFSTKSLDVDLASGNLQQWDWNPGSQNQQFIIVPTVDGHYKLIVMKTGKVLEVTNSSVAEAANINEWSNSNQDNSFWKLNAINTVGLQNINKAHINIFPNPTSSSITIESDQYNLSGASIKLINILGKQVFSDTINEQWKKQISTISLQPGIYTILITKNGQQSCTVILKK